MSFARSGQRSSVGVVTALLLASTVHCARYPAQERPVAPRSYGGPNGHAMVVVPPGEFTMGSPQNERGRSDVETEHRVRIPRSYAIATTEVTNAQLARGSRIRQEAR